MVTTVYAPLNLWWLYNIVTETVDLVSLQFHWWRSLSHHSLSPWWLRRTVGLTQPYKSTICLICIAASSPLHAVDECAYPTRIYLPLVFWNAKRNWGGLKNSFSYSSASEINIALGISYSPISMDFGSISTGMTPVVKTATAFKVGTTASVIPA